MMCFYSLICQGWQNLSITCEIDMSGLENIKCDRKLFIRKNTKKKNNI